jgi:selenocysteine-specific elongation factor
MGTAGHIDHGKTTLIRALTGFDCDTHKEEKLRGITINLGFTHLNLDSENSIGVIDVPGHSDFINTMISGAAGIDFVLLVIAADEGIMPQTYEHLEIMKLLNISTGIIILTKVDMVDDELIELASEEIRDFTNNSFLEDAPVIPFSAVNNQGLSQIVNEIKKITKSILPKNSEGIFRMYIDRIFTVQGFGTIVNGSVLSGQISQHDSLFLHPENREIRIRNMQRHGNNVERMYAGDRGALNIVGLKKSEFKRGMLLINQEIRDTELIDVKLTLFKNVKGLTVWNQVIFLLQTYKLTVKIHLLDANSLAEGESGIAQIYLPIKIVALIGDCFIIRNSSDTRTLGGGEVIDSHPLHHRRRKKEQIELVKKISSGEIQSLIENTVRKALKPMLKSELSEQLFLPASSLKDIENKITSADIKIYPRKADSLFIQSKLDTDIKEKIITFIKTYHHEFPIYKTGRTKQELLGLLNDKSKSTQTYLELALEDLQLQNILTVVENTWSLASHSSSQNSRNNQLISDVENFYKNAKGQLIQSADLKNTFPATSEKEMKMVITYLGNQKKLIKVDYHYFHADFVNMATDRLIAYLKENSEKGINVADFRDLINTNRKVAIILLDYFEKINVVINRNLVRFLKKDM